MLSASTARLVEDAARCWLSRNWFGSRVPTRRCPPVGCWAWATSIALDGRAESTTLVGRQWEMSAIESLLGRAVDSHGAVVAVVESTWHWQEPSHAGGRGDGGQSRGRGVHRPWTANRHHQPHPLPCRGTAAARGHRRRLAWTAKPPAIECATKSPTPTPRTCCCSMTYWASPTPACSAHPQDRSGCAAAQVDRDGQCRFGAWPAPKARRIYIIEDVALDR